MNTRAIALCGAFALADAVCAGFTGFLLVSDFVGDGWMENGFGETNLTAYRLYATFDGQDDDGVLAVFGQPGDPMTVQSSNGLFHNDPLGGLTAPLDLTGGGVWSNQWDTYVTIGTTTSAGDATGLSPGFAEETNELASNWSTTNAGWFVQPTDSQSEGTNVLIAQFVVAAGETVDGGVNILTREFEEIVGLGVDPGGACCVPEGCFLFTEDFCISSGGDYKGGLCEDVTCACKVSGDVTGEGCVDFADILLVLGEWGNSGDPGIPGDATCDGMITFTDLLKILDMWGDGCR